MGWQSLYEKTLSVVSSAAVPPTADSSPSGSQQDHTTSQSLRSRHQTQTTKKRSNSSVSSLNSITPKTPKKDIHVVQGDWKAKVGPDTYQHWAMTIGRFGIGMTEDGDSWSLQRATDSPLPTLHLHKLSRTATLMVRFTSKQTSS